MKKVQIIRNREEMHTYRSFGGISSGNMLAAQAADKEIIPLSTGMLTLNSLVTVRKPRSPLIITVDAKKSSSMESEVSVASLLRVNRAYDSIHKRKKYIRFGLMERWHAISYKLTACVNL